MNLNRRPGLYRMIRQHTEGVDGMHISKRAGAVSASITLAISAKANEMKAAGKDVVSFGAGEPDFPTPQWIIDAAKAAMDRGETRYTPASGTLVLKKAICNKLKRDNGLTYSTDQIVVSNGAKHSLFNACMAVLDEGDEVIIPAPYWVTYPELVRMAGGVPVFVETKKENGFVLTASDLEAAVTDRTRALILNSPSNPCGAKYGKEILEEIAQIAVRHDLIVISDEIYEVLSYDDEPQISIATLDGMYERTIVVNGLSKAYAMTGWRIGYTAAPKDVTKVMASYQSHATSNPNSIAQAAAVAALNGPTDDMKRMVEEFGKRRDLMISMIRAIPYLDCTEPKGAFYIMMDISGIFGKKINGQVITSPLLFCNALLDEELVAVVPGEAFGAPDCVRLSYAISQENIKKGLSRIESFVQKLR